MMTKQNWKPMKPKHSNLAQHTPQKPTKYYKAWRWTRRTIVYEFSDLPKPYRRNKTGTWVYGLLQQEQQNQTSEVRPTWRIGFPKAETSPPNETNPQDKEVNVKG